MTFSEVLMETRKAARITQRAAAASIGMDATYWNKLENGALRSLPTRETVELMASAVRASADDRRRLLAAADHSCLHPAHVVQADILEGSHHPSVKWCRSCGAYSVNGCEWREPMPEE